MKLLILSLFVVIGISQRAGATAETFEPDNVPTEAGAVDCTQCHQRDRINKPWTQRSDLEDQRMVEPLFRNDKKPVNPGSPDATA